MSISNRLSLTGKVSTFPKRMRTPNGIEHCQFIFEHRSYRQEAGFQRQVWCKIPVQISGADLIAKTQSITVGVDLFIVGFLISQKAPNQLTQLVLHAEQIEFID
ncbi:primosomal replication protein N [Actinobacillus delphinicola]|uniref:Replication restart protein PriB n=2 Tax=Actinobacillus delphinicola TaxID=51161 RepID=A0A448TUT7_9PAST|nr:primosomal replication protein N [Actinobacillus delphinicola]VEJ09631.1 primosomal replication protein N [Actinobacillus delphinicola]